MTDNWGGCWANDNEDAIRALYGLPPKPEPREFNNEFELDMLELYDLLPMRNFYAEKPGAYTKMYRLGMTERKIKRRLRELTKYWESTDWIWVWNEYSFQHMRKFANVENGHKYFKPNKFYMQPHRMHKNYAYKSSFRWDKDCYITRYYNRPRQKWQNEKEQAECPCNLCTGNRAREEDLWGMEEYSYYYEVESYYWREWNRAFYYHKDWLEWEEFGGYIHAIESNYNPSFYKAAYHLSVKSRTNLSYMMWLTNKGE